MSHSPIIDCLKIIYYRWIFSKFYSDLKSFLKFHYVIKLLFWRSKPIIADCFLIRFLTKERLIDQFFEFPNSLKKKENFKINAIISGPSSIGLMIKLATLHQTFCLDFKLQNKSFHGQQNLHLANFNFCQKIIFRCLKHEGYL